METKIDIKVVERYLSDFETLRLRARNVLEKYSEFLIGCDAKLEDFRIFSDRVCISWVDDYINYDNVDIPLDRFLDDWEDWVREEVDKDTIKKMAAEKERKEKHIESEKAELERLKEKYEEGGDWQLKI